MGRGRAAWLLLGLISALMVMSSGASGQALTLVARSGGPIATTPGATFGTSFSGAAVNDAGQVTFSGGIDDGTTSSGALFAGLPGDMRLLIRAGDDAAGTAAGVKYGSLWSDPQIDAAGRVAVTTMLAGAIQPGVDEAALYVGTPGALSLLARTGGAAPGTTAQYAPFFNVALGRAGHVGFASRLMGSGVTTTNRDAVFASSTPVAPLALRARQGSASPLPGSPTYTGVTREPPAVGGGGHIAFTAAASGGTSIITGTAGGAMSVLARSGTAAPGTSSTFTSFADDLHVDTTGRVAFKATLSGTNNGVASPQAFFLATPALGVTMVARGGDPAPDLPGAHLSQLLTAATRANDNAQLAFRATISGAGVDSTNNQAIFAGPAGAVRLIARTGDPVPDADPVTSNPKLFALSQPLISDDGLVAFHATFDGSLSPANGIFVTDAAGELFTLVRSGQQLVVDGTPHTVRDLRMQSDDPNASALSGAGHLVFSATFTDDTSAVFVTTLPEPSAAMAALLLTAGFVTARRRRR